MHRSPTTTSKPQPWQKGKPTHLSNSKKMPLPSCVQLVFLISMVASVGTILFSTSRLNANSNYQPTQSLAVPPTQESLNLERSKTAVLILFGVPKHFRLVFTSYMKNIVQRNPRMKFEVYMHMNSDLHLTSYSNGRNDEKNAMLDSPDVIRTILDEVGGDNITTHLTTSSQKLFMDPNLSWIQQSDVSFFKDGSYSFRTVLNQFRQGTSLREAFFSYQEQNINWNDNHHVYVFARSDTFLISPVDIPSEIGGTDAIVPSWHGWSGYNDRFAVAGPDAAKVYATKVDGYKEAILACRSNPEAEPLFTNAETLLKMWLLGNKLNVIEHEDDWAWALLRLRADGRIEARDSEEFKIENVTLVEHLPYYLE